MFQKPFCSLLALSMLACLAIRSAHADAAKGAQIARQCRTNCHFFGNNPAGPVPQGPPSFQMVARSGMSADQLRAFLSHQHGAMPNLALTRAEIDDLINYIETLH